MLNVFYLVSIILFNIPIKVTHSFSASALSSDGYTRDRSLNFIQIFKSGCCCRQLCSTLAWRPHIFCKELLEEKIK
jgi:hypothetical protein